MPTPNQNTPGEPRGGVNPNIVQAAADLASGSSVFQAAKNALTNSMQDKLLGPTAAFAGGLIGVLSVMKKIVDQSGILQRGLQQIASIQNIQGKFETLLQSAVLAKKRIQELYQFAANSPFQLGDVAEANRLLQSLTSGALAGQKGMKLVGDAAAATSSSMSEMAEKVGKAYNALQSGRSMDRIIFNLQMSGLVTDDMASKLENLSEVGAGFAEKWSVVETALRQTEGGMKNEMQNLDALSTKLENVSNEMERAFGKAFVDAKAKSIKVSIQATENITPLMEQIGSDIAPVLTLANQFKTRIAESTLATKGFAAALGVAWNAGKIAFGTVALTTLANITKNTPPMVRDGGRFLGSTLGNARRGIMEAKMPGGGLAEASSNWGSAKNALSTGGGGPSVAASFAAQAVAGQIATRVMVVHTAAMQAVGVATGIAAVRNYAAAASTTVLAGAGMLAMRAFKLLAASVWASTVALAKSPVTWVAAAVVGTFALVRSIDAAEAAYRDLNVQLDETRRKLREQAQSAHTEKAWAENVQNYTDELQKASEALEAFQAKRREQRFERPLDSSTENDLASHRLQIITARRMAIMNRGNVGLTDREKEAYKTDVENDRNAQTQTFQQQYDRADGEAQNRIIERRIKLLEKAAEAGEAARNAQEMFDRSFASKKAAADEAELSDRINATTHARTLAEAAGGNSKPLNDAYATARARQKEKENEVAQVRRNAGDELTRKRQQQLDIQADLEAHPGKIGIDDPRMAQIRSLQRETIKLQSLVQNAPANRQEIAELQNRLSLSRQAQTLKAEELSWDERIANARKAGLETGGMETQKQLAISKLQVEQAKANRQPMAEREARLNQSQFEASQVAFRRDAALERERNRDLVTPGKGQDAQGVDDYRALRSLTEQYLQNGMTAEQAKKDFDLSVKARNPEQPRISVDSLQAVGGGGFSSNPNSDYPRRSIALTEQMVQYLSIIANKGAQGGVIE